MLKLYGFWRSIATYRVRVALRLKGLPFEESAVDLLKGEQFGDGFSAVNAAHAVPALMVDGRAITQSLAIIEYLDEKHPSPPLLPAALEERAQARALALLTIADAHPLIVPRIRKALAQTYGATPPQVDDWARRWLTEGLTVYDSELARRPPAPFALGEAPGLADICVMSHVVAAQLFGAPMEGFAHVTRLRMACEALEAFSQSHPLRQPGAPARTCQ
jgi:maleylpyruvate isomerase